MKRPLLAVASIALALGISAQVVEVQSIEPVNLKTNLSVDLARVSPDGTFAIVSNNSSSALDRVDLATGEVTNVTNNGSALELAFTPDNRSVIYKRAIVGERNLRYYSVETTDLKTGASRNLAAPRRHCAAFSISGVAGNITIAEQGTIRRAAAHGNVATNVTPVPVVSINRGHLELTRPDGTTVNLDPQGKGSYLWPSISPDGTKIVYFRAGRGCYVCDLEGKVIADLGYLHAARWLGNNAVIGCKDYDDGSVITKSYIVAADLNGATQTLTDDSLIALCPSASADGRTVLFSTADGKMYRINLK